MSWIATAEDLAAVKDLLAEYQREVRNVAANMERMQADLRALLASEDKQAGGLMNVQTAVYAIGKRLPPSDVLGRLRWLVGR